MNASTASSPSTTNAKSQQAGLDQLPDLLELFCDLVRSKTKVADVEQILAGRKSDLARQQEKTPDFPSSWQAIQRGVVSGERELNKSSKEYQQHSERLRSVLSQLSNPIGDLVASIVQDATPEHRTGAASANSPPTGPKALQNADVKPIEARLVELEKKQQSMAARTANELQIVQAAMKAVNAEREELRERNQATSRREKAVDNLLEDHKKLVSEHQDLNERCAKLEAANQKLSADNSRFERLLESNRKAYEEVDKEADGPRIENTKLREDIDKSKSELESIKKEQSLSEDRHQKATSTLRSNFKTLSESHDKVVTRVSNVEKRAAAMEGSLDKTTNDLKGLGASAESGSRNTIPISEGISAEITEKIRHINAEATAELISDIKSVADLVQSHQALLLDFEPGELDRLWWTVPKIKEENDRLKEQVSALEKLHSELKTEVQRARQGASGGADRDASASAQSKTSTPSSAIDNSRRDSDGDALRMAEEAAKYAQDLKKAQDGIIEGMGGMIDAARSSVKSMEKSTGVEFASIKERLDALEKSTSESNGTLSHTDTHTDTVGSQQSQKIEQVSGTDSDIADTNHKLRCLTGQHNKLDRFVRESFSDYSERLTGLQQLCLDWKRQAANATSAPPPPNSDLPNFRSPARPGVVRQTSDSHEVKRPLNGALNGSVKRRRMESPRLNGSPPRY